MRKQMLGLGDQRKRRKRRKKGKVKELLEGRGGKGVRVHDETNAGTGRPEEKKKKEKKG